MGAKLSGGGRNSGKHYTVDSNADINVTPFVDIMLVLLIIFMVSVPVATVSIKLDMPPATPPKEGEIPEPPVYITIQETGELFIGKGPMEPVPTTLEGLAADLTRVFNKPDPTEERVFVRAEADVQYGQFMEVLNNLQDNGWYQVGLINEDIT